MKRQNQLHLVLGPKVDNRREEGSLDCSPAALGLIISRVESPLDWINQRTTRTLYAKNNRSVVFCFYKPCLRMVGHLLWPLLRRCVREVPIVICTSGLNLAFCISVSLYLWWSSWGLRDLGTTFGDAFQDSPETPTSQRFKPAGGVSYRAFPVCLLFVCNL